MYYQINQQYERKFILFIIYNYTKSFIFTSQFDFTSFIFYKPKQPISLDLPTIPLFYISTNTNISQQISDSL
jgi:hypothetical protein